MRVLIETNQEMYPETTMLFATLRSCGRWSGKARRRQRAWKCQTRSLCDGKQRATPGSRPSVRLRRSAEAFAGIKRIADALGIYRQTWAADTRSVKCATWRRARSEGCGHEGGPTVSVLVDWVALSTMSVEQFRRWVEAAGGAAPGRFRAACDMQRTEALRQAERLTDQYLSPQCCYTTGVYHMPWCTEEPRLHEE